MSFLNLFPVSEIFIFELSLFSNFNYTHNFNLQNQAESALGRQKIIHHSYWGKVLEYSLLTFYSALIEVTALIASLKGKQESNFKSGEIKCHKEYSNTSPNRSGVTFHYNIVIIEMAGNFRFIFPGFCAPFKVAPGAAAPLAPP